MDEVRHYMGKVLVTVAPETSVTEAARLMSGKKVGSMLVRFGQEYVGIVTEVDFTRKVLGEGRDPRQTTIAEIMSGPLKTMEGDRSMDEAFVFMHAHNFRHLPIVENGVVAGIVSIRDVARYFSEKYIQVNDPIAEFWENYECLVGRTAFLHALDRLVSRIRESLKVPCDTARAIDGKKSYGDIADAADADGLKEFAEILRRS